jgi:hypothetical protein
MGFRAVDFYCCFLRAALFFTPLYSRLRKVAVHALYGTIPQPLLAMLAPGKTLKSCPDTCLRADVESCN